MATNLQKSSGWRFSKVCAADHRVGLIDQPTLPLSRVEAASSAFPPVLFPSRISLADQIVRTAEGANLHHEPYTKVAVLTVGGVYDNFGLERVWKRCRTILVSNAVVRSQKSGNPADAESVKCLGL